MRKLLGLFLGILMMSEAVNAQSSCPKDIKALTDSLLEDLPGYANRVLQRTKSPSRTQTESTYFILAAKPEYNPLTDNLKGDYDPAIPKPQKPKNEVKQVFFTTLERQYRSESIHSVQNYHWLFLTHTNQGWYLVMLYSRFGSVDRDRPPYPPRETSQGILGQAIQLWLRDCRFEQ